MPLPHSHLLREWAELVLLAMWDVPHLLNASTYVVWRLLRYRRRCVMKL